MLINYHNPTITSHHLLQNLQVNATLLGVDKALQQHPNYPSLLSITDVLSDYKVENAAYKIEANKLAELPTPFISFLNGNGGNFVVVNQVSNGNITYSLNNKSYTTPQQEFIKDWNQVVLLAEATKESQEPNYIQNKKQEQWQTIKIPVLLGLGVLLIFATAFLQHNSQITNNNSLITNNNFFSFSIFHFLVFGLITLAGVFVSILLLWYEVDRANPALQKICTGAKNVNCGAILNSKQSKLFGIISWSEVGFFYFGSSFLLLLLQSSNALPLLALLNVLALPYTVFSIYYQWQVAKQWCVLCLWVQAILVAQFATTLFLSSVSFSNLFSQQNLSSIIFSPFGGVRGGSLFSSVVMVLFLLLWYFIKPLLITKQRNKRNLQEFNRMKYNPDVFFGLLQKQKHIGNSANNLGIAVGNLSAENTVIKVCNPYCGPCAKAHPRIENLLHQIPNLKAQVIFTATNKEDDHRLAPSRHLVAVDSLGNKTQTNQALDDWYLAKEKDYAAFAQKYPLNGKLEKQGEKIEAMDKWCKDVGITFTPTIFFNGYQLPEAYNIEDLRHFMEAPSIPQGGS